MLRGKISVLSASTGSCQEVCHIARVDLDLAKSVFQAHGINAAAQAVVCPRLALGQNA
jgi:hypothetical protein